MSQEFTDYSTILMSIERLEKEIHDACLEKEFEKAATLTNAMLLRVFDLAVWLKTQ